MRKKLQKTASKLPEISLPKWISTEIRSVLTKHFEFMKTQKLAPIAIRERFDLYAYLVKIFNNAKKVFTDVRMKPIWEKLDSLSKEKSANFASKLLYRIQNDYDGGMTLIEKHKAEILSSERVIAKVLIERLTLSLSWKLETSPGGSIFLCDEAKLI